MKNIAAHQTFWLYIPLHDTFPLCEQINTLVPSYQQLITTNKIQKQLTFKDFLQLKQTFLHPDTPDKFWMSGQQWLLQQAHTVCGVSYFASVDLRPFLSRGQKCSAGEKRKTKLIAHV